MAPQIVKCTKKEKKPLIYKDFRLIFNDKKKTVGRYYPYQSTVPYLVAEMGFEPHDYRTSRIIVAYRLGTLGSADSLLRCVNRRKNDT